MKALALIPARAGSLRVPNKNIKKLCGHPLIAYTITVAKQSGVFSRIIVSTNSAETKKIAEYYGAAVPFIRPQELATSTSPDIEWIKHAFSELDWDGDVFSILRPTSPFRSREMIQRAFDRFGELAGKYKIDSLRAVELCHEHPGKMWALKGELMEPLLDQSHLEVAWHAGQYQALPKVYVQNSSLEMAWVRAVRETNTREGKIIAPFFTEGNEGFSIDYQSDWQLAEIMISHKEAVLPEIDRVPYAG